MSCFLEEDKVYPGYIMPLHFEKNVKLGVPFCCEKRYRLVHIIKGNGIIGINGYRKIFIAPAVLCLNEDESIDFIESEGYIADILHYHPQVVNSNFDYAAVLCSESVLSLSEKQDLFYLKPYFEHKTSDKSVLQIGINAEMRVRTLMATIYAITQNYSFLYWPCTIRTHLIELLMFIRHVETRTAQHIVHGEADGIQKILMHIQANCHKQLTIEDLTSRFHTNRSTLARDIKKATGYTVIEYLNRYRIEKAMALLSETGKTIHEILYIVGFNDDRHFNRLFRRICGLSPSEYRKSFL